MEVDNLSTESYMEGKNRMAEENGRAKAMVALFDGEKKEDLEEGINQSFGGAQTEEAC